MWKGVSDILKVVLGIRGMRCLQQIFINIIILFHSASMSTTLGDTILLRQFCVVTIKQLTRVSRFTATFLML